jgi:hypothetical protein
MSTDQERNETYEQTTHVLSYICENNAEAKEYLELLLRCLRIIDDVHDEDYPVSKEDLLFVFEALFIRLPMNKFFVAHRDFFLSQHMVTWNTWEISNLLRSQPEDFHRMYGQVLSGYIHELLPLVAFLIGGYHKMKETNGLIRTLYQDKLEDEHG